MRWKGRRKSSNVEDRRVQSAGIGGGSGSGLLSFIPMLVRSKTGRTMLLIGVVAAVGPFYCPGDQKLYVDLSFFQDLKQRHGAPGDFAQAYVIAHEVGHQLSV
jgi:predicted metalloprotease